MSLITKDNDYQIEQALAAEETARGLGVDVAIMYAGGDAITQSQQLLKVIQSSADLHPAGIMLEPAGGTALPQVAAAAAKADIGWAVLNRDVGYISDLRKVYRTPLFCVSCDNQAAGRIQGRQVQRLLPNGGLILYIQGPSDSVAARQRTEGMYETKGVIELKLLRGHWTEESSHKAVNSWLQLSTSRQSNIDAIVAQNDAMAITARKAFKEMGDQLQTRRWLELPYFGIDGVRTTGQAWVKQGLLRATIIVPPNTSKALEMMVRALQTGTMPPEMTMMAPVGFPAVEDLSAGRATKSQAASR